MLKEHIVMEKSWMEIGPSHACETSELSRKAGNFKKTKK